MRSIARILIAAACLIAAALPAAAQQRMPGPAGETPNEQQREEIRRKMEAIRIARLTEVLRLDEQTAAKFIPAITSIDQKRRMLLKENQETLREMRSLLKAPQPDERRLKTAIGKIEKNHHEVLSLRDREFSAVKSNLTVQQQARYLLFHQEFQKEMRGVVEGIHGGMGPGPASGRGRGPMRGAPTE